MSSGETIASSVLAVIYNNGVLVAADNVLSTSKLKLSFDACRLLQIDSHSLLAGSGLNGHIQLIADELQIYVKETNLRFDHGIRLKASEIQNYLRKCVYQQRLKLDPLIGNFIFAGFEDGRPVLARTDMYGTTVKEHFACTSLGSYFAIAHLRREATPDMSLEQARKLLLKCFSVLRAADTRNPHTIQFAQVTREGVALLPPEEIPLNESTQKLVCCEPVAA